MKLDYFIFILVVLIGASAYDTGITLERVKAGIDAAKGICDALKVTSNSESFHNLAMISEMISPFLEAIGPVVGFISSCIPSSQTNLMKNEFWLLNSKIDEVFYEVGEVKDLIKKTSLKLEYSSYEHTILSLSHELQNYLDANAENAQFYKSIFVNEYKNSYNGAAQKLYNGMMNKGNVFSHDIPNTAMEFTNYHRRQTQIIMKGTLNLIILGVKVTLAYHKAEGISDSNYTSMSNKWDTQIKRLIDHIIRKDNEVKNAWEKQLEKDVDSKLQQFSGRSHKDFSDDLYDFLSEKYDWRHWFVVAYNPTAGWVNHCVRYCGGFYRFRQSGRNIGVASVPKSKQAESYWSTRLRLNVYDTCKWHYFDFLANLMCKGAKELCDEIDSVVRTGCSLYASYGVIMGGNELNMRGPPGRYVFHNDYAHATIFAFS